MTNAALANGITSAAEPTINERSPVLALERERELIARLKRENCNSDWEWLATPQALVNLDKERGTLALCSLLREEIDRANHQSTATLPVLFLKEVIRAFGKDPQESVQFALLDVLHYRHYTPLKDAAAALLATASTLFVKDELVSMLNRGFSPLDDHALKIVVQSSVDITGLEPQLFEFLSEPLSAKLAGGIVRRLLAQEEDVLDYMLAHALVEPGLARENVRRALGEILPHESALRPIRLGIQFEGTAGSSAELLRAHVDKAVVREFLENELKPRAELDPDAEQRFFALIESLRGSNCSEAIYIVTDLIEHGCPVQRFAALGIASSLRDEALEELLISVAENAAEPVQIRLHAAIAILDPIYLDTSFRLAKLRKRRDTPSELSALLNNADILH